MHKPLDFIANAHKLMNTILFSTTLRRSTTGNQIKSLLPDKSGRPCKQSSGGLIVCALQPRQLLGCYKQRISTLGNESEKLPREFG